MYGLSEPWHTGWDTISVQIPSNLPHGVLLEYIVMWEEVLLQRWEFIIAPTASIDVIANTRGKTISMPWLVAPTPPGQMWSTQDIGTRRGFYYHDGLYRSTTWAFPIGSDTSEQGT